MAGGAPLGHATKFFLTLQIEPAAHLPLMPHDLPKQPISELDEAWAAALARAEQRARVAGRPDIAEYLALRTSNDLLRKTANDWLFASFTNIAGELNRAGAAIKISTDDQHRFQVDNATMQGRLMKFENGIRALVVEAGWPRVPRHGFIRGGGLALGNIKHFGIKSASQSIRLITSAEGTPRWVIENALASDEIREVNIRKHLAILLDDSYVE